MTTSPYPGYVADAILVLHVAFAGFVVFGLLFIVLGGFVKWKWIRNPWFRLSHLCAVAVVVVQSWCGAICPLTTWEMQLRDRAGQPTYDGSFVAYWLQRLLYYEAPPWAFVIAYSVVGALLVLTWFTVRPSSFKNR
jgi:hypothetical protein